MGWMYHDQYGAATGLLKLLNYVNNNPAPITGIEFYVNLLKTFVGRPPPILAGVVLGRQIALVGGYPTARDYAPSIGCAVMYGVLALIHLFNFLFGVYRGHYFYMTLGWILVCLFRVLGFSIRACWSQDITMIHMALAGEFFLILGTYINLPFTILMAQRLFTWRHPVGGSRKLFITVMIGVYTSILILAGAVVFAHFVPYLHSLSESTFSKYWDFEIAISILTSVIIGLYVLLSVILTIWRPTIKDESLFTYQPWWIESFSTFYFPPKNAAQKADAKLMRCHSNHREIVRIIAATPHKYTMVESLTNERGNLKHNKSFYLLIISTAFQLVGTIGRCIVVTQRRPTAIALYPVQGTFLYFSWGGLEAFIQVLYIVWRVDLRFYKPDVLIYKIRDSFDCFWYRKRGAQNKVIRRSNLGEFQKTMLEFSNTSNETSEQESFPMSIKKSTLYHEDIFVYSNELSH